MDHHSGLELRKFVAPEFVFGAGALSLAGRYAKNYGASKVLVVSDKGVIGAGWTDKVIRYLENERLDYAVFSGLTPNPKADEVMSGAGVYEREGCDVIVAVGGGSVLDCAKCIGIVSTNRKDIMEFVGVDLITMPGPPLVCIPTTAGSSADVSQFAIITDRKRKIKTSIVSKTLVPDAALIDPETTTTMTHGLTVETGLDAFVHAVEAYVSNASSPITDLFALSAVRTISASLAQVLHEPENLEYRNRMMLGSLEAGLAFSNASLGLTHAMAHSLGGLLDVHHGESNAILYPLVVRFNYDAVPKRYGKIAEAMGLDLSQVSESGKKAAVIAEIGKLKGDVGIGKTLRQLGVRKDDIPMLVENAMNDVCMVTNPRPVRCEDVTRLFSEAL